MSRSGGTSRKRVSLSSPPQEDSSSDEDALYQRLLETAGIHSVTDHIASLSRPTQSSSERLDIERVAASMLPCTRGGMVSRLLITLEEIDRVDAMIHLARVKAQKLHRVLDRTLSPISHLPDEVLSIIFEFGAQEEIDRLLANESFSLRMLGIMNSALRFVTSAVSEIRSGPTPKEYSRPPLPWSLTLSHVSQNWRSLAAERSTLWTRIRPFWPAEQVQMWIHNSKNQPLHIDLMNVRKAFIAPETVKLLRQHVNRWKSVCVSLNEEIMDVDEIANYYAKFIFGGQSGGVSGSLAIPLPSLTWLSISSPHTAVKIPLPILNESPLLPNLERLILRHAAPEALDSFFHRVVCARVDLSGLFTWNWTGIGCATRLKILTIRSSPAAQDQESGLEGHEAPLDLPTLEHLCIDYAPNGVCQSLLALLRAPNLVSFHLLLKGKDRATRQALTDFAFAHPSVLRVELFGTPAEAFRFLSPSLSVLPSATPSHAHPNSISSQPFPRLVSLTIGKPTYMNIDIEDLDLLLAFISHRQTLSRPGQTHARLKILKVDRLLITTFGHKVLLTADKDKKNASSDTDAAGDVEPEYDEDYVDVEGSVTDAATEADEFMDDEDEDEDDGGDEVEAVVEDDDDNTEDEQDTENVEIDEGSHEGSEDEDDAEGHNGPNEDPPNNTMIQDEGETEILRKLVSQSLEKGIEILLRCADEVEAIEYDWEAENDI